MVRKGAVIWNRETNKVEFYRNGTWDGSRYTQPTLVYVMKPDDVAKTYPQQLRIFKAWEKTLKIESAVVSRPRVTL